MTKHIKTFKTGSYVIDFYKNQDKSYFYEIKKDDDYQETLHPFGDFEDIAEASEHALNIFKKYYEFINISNY